MSAYLGHAVVDGLVRFFSVSSILRADPMSSGCLRKWHYRYKGGIKDTDSEGKTKGIALHAELRDYLRGEAHLKSALAIKGSHFLPEPGPDLLVEQPIANLQAGIVLLTAAGIPVIGDIDCVSDRGVNKGADDVTDLNDPAGTIEVYDWKFKSNAVDRDGNSTLMHKNELIRSIQMAGYGKTIPKFAPRASYVRLSHGYFPERGGAPRKVTKLHVIDDCDRTWEYAEAIARTVVDAAREPNADRVDANVRACDSFGGCPARDVCTARKQANVDVTLDKLFGRNATMGLLAQLPPALAPAPTQPAPTVQTAAPSVTIDMRAQLAAEEAAQRAAAAANAPGVPPGLAQAWDYIMSRSSVMGANGQPQGWPVLGGAAASMIASIKGVNYSGAANACLAGNGRLAGLTLTDPAQVLAVATELLNEQNAAGQQAPVVQQLAAQPVHVQHFTVPTSVLPPDAPASDPALAARSVEGMPNPAIPVPPLVAAVQAFTPAAVAAAPVQTTQQTIINNATAPAPAGRKPRKPRTSNPASAAPQNVAPAVSSQQAASQVATADAGTDLEIFVDTIPNCEFESLQPYITAICDALVHDFCPPNALRDVRCAPADGPLGFGRWRGALAAIVRERPPAPGSYFIDTRGSEIAEVVADALLIVCNSNGYAYYRGIK